MVRLRRRSFVCLMAVLSFFMLDFILGQIFVPPPDEKEDHPVYREHELSEDERKYLPIDLNATIATWSYFPYKPQSVKEPVIELNPSQCETILSNVDRSPPKPRKPTNNSCDGYDGVLLIQHGDIGGASGTVFFQFMVGMLWWADQHNYKPWVHMNNFSTKVYDSIVHGQGPDTHFQMQGGVFIDWARDARDKVGYLFPGRPIQAEEPHTQEFVVKGTGVWEHYFEPVSDFVPGDSSCTNKSLARLEIAHVTPGIHSQSPWTPRAWRISFVEHIERHDMWLQEWLMHQRRNATISVQRYIRFNAYMEQRAACAHPNPQNSLGMHIRHSDKWTSRYIIPVREFLPYCTAFVDHGGASIYLATDSSKVLNEILLTWPGRVVDRLIVQEGVKGLSSNGSAAFDLGIGNHRTNTEALTDLLALSKCTYLLHGLSALTEAVFYINPGLARRAINLDDNELDYTVGYFVNHVLPRGRNMTLSSGKKANVKSAINASHLRRR